MQWTLLWRCSESWPLLILASLKICEWAFACRWLPEYAISILISRFGSGRNAPTVTVWIDAVHCTVRIYMWSSSCVLSMMTSISLLIHTTYDVIHHVRMIFVIAPGRCACGRVIRCRWHCCSCRSLRRCRDHHRRRRRLCCHRFSSTNISGEDFDYYQCRMSHCHNQFHRLSIFPMPTKDSERERLKQFAYTIYGMCENWCWLRLMKII